MTYTEGFSVQLSPLYGKVRPVDSRMISKGMHQRRKAGFWENCWARSLGPDCNSELYSRFVTTIFTGGSTHREETSVHRVQHHISSSWLSIPEWV